MNNPTVYYADINDPDETGSDEPVFCHVVLDSEYNQLRAELAALKAKVGRGGAVAWQFFQDGKWWNGDDRIKDHRNNTEAAGYPIRDLYTAPPASADAVSVPPEWRDMLEELQWQHRDHDDYYHNPAGFYCPSCFASQEAGHASQCRIRALLRGAGRDDAQPWE